MQDSLIGYLLGALDADETARLEALLDQDPELRERLRQASRSLRPLQADEDDIEPPPGLAYHTCCHVERASRRIFAAHHERGTTSPQWTLVDMTIAAGIFLAACLLFFPAINNSRYHARITACQNNLRQIGRALIQYSENAQGLFPQVPPSGNLAVAGMYAPTLRDLGLILEDHIFLCPGSARSARQIPFRVPGIEQIQQARGPVLAAMHRDMGGDYGYTLGYMSGQGMLHAIPNRNRPYFVLMSDAPGEACFAETCVSRSNAHRNVLFESGHVRQVSHATVCWGKDELYTNDRGEIAAGIHVNDTVIGNSHTAPLLNASLSQ